MLIKFIFGGSFDPFHNGHLSIALELNRLYNCKISLMPLAGIPNYKPNLKASTVHRLNMLNLIIDKYPESLDLELSETTYAEYVPSVISLNNLKKHYGPSSAIYFIIGSDSLLSLDTWDNYTEIFKLCNLIVIPRSDYKHAQLNSNLQTRITQRLESKLEFNRLSGGVFISSIRPPTISSTTIRNLIANEDKFEHLVPVEITNYILKHDLYKGA